MCVVYHIPFKRREQTKSDLQETPQRWQETLTHPEYLDCSSEWEFSICLVFVALSPRDLCGIGACVDVCVCVFSIKFSDR